MKGHESKYMTEIIRFAQNRSRRNMSLLQCVSFCGSYVTILRFREVSITTHNPRPIVVTVIADSEAVGH